VRIRSLIACLAVPAAALGLSACGGAADTKEAAAASGGGGTKLSLVAYSTPQVVYDQLIPAFQKTAAGRGLAFNESFGASGEQSRAVAAGLPADVVTFSLAPDVDRLVTAGLVDRRWSANRYHGIVTKSVVVLIVRKGNPKHIRTWDDLLKPGVQVLTPNPFTSGAAKWNLLAAYGAKGLPYVRELLTKHVKVQDKSGREALQDFLSGTGDVLLSYENEAKTAQLKGQKLDYVIPDRTIQIENPIAVVAKSRHRAQAQAFVDYVLSPPAQRLFAKWGYRPVNAQVWKSVAARFRTPKGLFTIGSLGGWKLVDPKFFDPKTGLIAAIERDAGVSTAK
jgi:sulfate transport system substrate-binding protein